MRPHGRARVSARGPQAFGICDRCGFLYNHNQLRWQMDWAGASLINKRMLVCDECYDTPQQQLRAIVVPADPVPIQNPRTQDYCGAANDERITQGNTVNQQTGIPVPGGDVRITQDDQTRIIQQTGEPPGGLNTFPGLDTNVPNAGDIGLPCDNTEIPQTGWLSPYIYTVSWTNYTGFPQMWIGNVDLNVTAEWTTENN